MSSAVSTPSIPGISPLAGLPAPKEMLVDLTRIERDYFEWRLDVHDPNQMVAFGTSGHRGSPLDGTFTEAHILAITQAICDYRRANGPDGPLYLGEDTHAISDPAQRTALEVLAANEVDTIIQRSNGITPVPVISRAILAYNRGRQAHLADGIAVTPSHNPPEDGGFKYNPPHGGPADTDVTQWVENRANELLREKNAGVKRMPFAAAIGATPTTHQEDFVLPYVRDLRNMIDMEAIRAARLKLAVDPLGGAAEPYWGPINAEYRLDIDVVNETIDPTFSFMTVDHDGVIRMDCSSPYAMARLVGIPRVSPVTHVLSSHSRDHFRGFTAAWHVPAGAPTAESGNWRPGPGAEFFSAVQRELGSLPFIAEDLGLVTPDVYALRDLFHLPGMRVLQFAFDGHPDNPHLPHNYVTNSVVFTGTHDNPTTRGWFEDLSDDQRRNVWSYLQRPAGSSGEVAPALMGLAWARRRKLALALHGRYAS